MIATIWAYLLDSLGVFGGRFSGWDFPKQLPARVPLLHRPTVFHPPGKQAPDRKDNTSSYNATLGKSGYAMRLCYAGH